MSDLKVGDNVQWTVKSQHGRSITISRRDGVIEDIHANYATVKMSNGRTMNVRLDGLRLSSSKSEIMEMLDSMRARR